MEPVTFSPIARFECEQSYKYDVPRQATLGPHRGTIRLARDRGFEQSLVGLQGGDWVWLIFVFHENASWKPLVRPPRGSGRKVGVFATRAPYRPNPIGISCVQIESLDGLSIQVSHHDLIDGTPILDIKPYLDIADSHPGVSPSWLESEEMYSVEWEPSAYEKAQFLESSGVDLRPFADYQLQFNPFDQKRKRVQKLGDDRYELAYRTWRISFSVSGNELSISNVKSAYSEIELCEKNDKWNDKELHRSFSRAFQ